MEEGILSHTNHKVGMPLLMSDKEYFRMKNTTRNLRKGLIHHKDIEVLNAYSHSNRVLKYMKQKLIKLKEIINTHNFKRFQWLVGKVDGNSIKK